MYLTNHDCQFLDNSRVPWRTAYRYCSFFHSAAILPHRKWSHPILSRSWRSLMYELFVGGGDWVSGVKSESSGSQSESFSSVWVANGKNCLESELDTSPSWEAPTVVTRCGVSRRPDSDRSAENLLALDDVDAGDALQLPWAVSCSDGGLCESSLSESTSSDLRVGSGAPLCRWRK